MARSASVAGAEKKCLEIAEEMGYELIDITVDREDTGKYLRVYIDQPEGISLDDCEKFHRAVQKFFDDCDYDYMEVSSPGIDRPLKKDRDFERNIGTEIEVHLFRPLNGTKLISGILTGLDGEDITLEQDGNEIRIPRKSASLVKPVIDMSGVEEVDLSGDDSLFDEAPAEEKE